MVSSLKSFQSSKFDIDKPGQFNVNVDVTNAVLYVLIHFALVNTAASLSVTLYIPKSTLTGR